MTTTPTDDATNRAIDLLRSQGFSVTSPDNTATPGSYAAKLGLAVGSLGRMLRRDDCPAFWASLGDTGRLIKLRPTPELTKWILSRKRKHR